MEGAAAVLARGAESDPMAVVTEAYVAHFDRLVGVGWRLVHDRSAAEDLAHDAFIDLTRELQRNPGYLRGEPWPWLRTAVTHNAAKWHRSRTRRARREAAWVTSVVVPPDEPAIDIHAALRTLPPRMRQCATLFFLQDRSYREIAILMGCGPRTVKEHLRRTRRRLRRLLPLEEPVWNDRLTVPSAADAARSTAIAA